MNKAGIRFWWKHELPSEFTNIVPPKKPGKACYLPWLRIIQVDLSSNENDIRHEFAHAWDHIKALPENRLHLLDKAGENEIGQEIEGTVKWGSGTKDMEKKFEQYKNRLPKVERKSHSFENPSTLEEHSLKSVQEFYAEGYSVFHGSCKSCQAKLLMYAPELYDLFEKESKKKIWKFHLGMS